MHYIWGHAKAARIQLINYRSINSYLIIIYIYKHTLRIGDMISLILVMHKISHLKGYLGAYDCMAKTRMEFDKNMVDLERKIW